MKDAEIKTYIDEGRRHYRLKWSVNRCPFDDPEIKRAWRAGYFSAIKRKSANEALAAFHMGISFNMKSRWTLPK
jgi:hypothetical protein